MTKITKTRNDWVRIQRKEENERKTKSERKHKDSVSYFLSYRERERVVWRLMWFVINVKKVGGTHMVNIHHMKLCVLHESTDDSCSNFPLLQFIKLFGLMLFIDHQLTGFSCYLYY